MYRPEDINPRRDNRSIVQAVLRAITAEAAAKGRRPSETDRLYAVTQYMTQHDIGQRRYNTLCNVMEAEAKSYVWKDSALVYAKKLAGDRHNRIHELRKARRDGTATPKEDAVFEMLYEEESQWLRSHGVKYTPTLGWHFTA